MHIFLWMAIMMAFGTQSHAQGSAQNVWSAECEQFEAGKKCFASYHLLNGGASMVQVAAGYFGNNNNITFVVRFPSDIAIQSPLPVSLDNNKKFNLIPLHCNSAGCFASVLLSPRDLDLLYKSQTLRLSFSMFGDPRMIIGTIPLAGFRAIFEPLKK